MSAANTTITRSDNWKTVLCSFFEKGQCRYQKAPEQCHHAHGVADLRCFCSSDTHTVQDENGYKLCTGCDAWKNTAIFVPCNAHKTACTGIHPSRDGRIFFAGKDAYVWVRNVKTPIFTEKTWKAACVRQKEHERRKEQLQTERQYRAPCVSAAEVAGYGSVPVAAAAALDVQIEVLKEDDEFFTPKVAMAAPPSTQPSWAEKATATSAKTATVEPATPATVAPQSTKPTWAEKAVVQASAVSANQSWADMDDDEEHAPPASHAKKHAPAAVPAAPVKAVPTAAAPATADQDEVARNLNQQFAEAVEALADRDTVFFAQAETVQQPIYSMCYGFLVQQPNGDWGHILLIGAPPVGMLVHYWADVLQEDGTVTRVPVFGPSGQAMLLA